uniref:tryptophan 5-hydroxylase 1-like n=1 Tax=Styela clava TaxID=7725 RepID=UPI0019398C26|nr:tryptophan 5-hydroxylase 1-like [Styela clava]
MTSNSKYDVTPAATSLDDFMNDEQKRKQQKTKLSLADYRITFTVAGGVKYVELPEIFKECKVTILHDETRKSREGDNVDCYVECIVSEPIDDVIAQLNEFEEISNLKFEMIPVLKGPHPDTIAWFPRCLADLDHCSGNVILCGELLDADHPGFKDTEYRKRRSYFTEVALNYKYGDPIPRIEYTTEETETWRKVYSELMTLYPTHACKEQMVNLELLEKNCGFNGASVPQLADVSAFLQKRTGFTLRPVAGFLSPRDFLAGLALRVFNCTQYMRHSSNPLYTPEPDVCHELLGHVPLFADPSFAQFSHELGLASLGASDADIKRLASCYLYTVEFGLCKEEGKIKAYGAGLLSCIAEMKHALTSPEKIKKFEPEVAANTESYVTSFQPIYFMSESLEQAKDKMRNFASSIEKPFKLKFDDVTNSIHVIENMVETTKKSDLIERVFIKTSSSDCDVIKTL